MSENIELLFNIKEIQICWTEECTTDARIITLPSQTSTRSSRLPVSYPLWLLVAAFRELTVSLPPPFDAFRWQTHDPILEEKCRLKPRWHPQAQIARHVPHRPHQEIRRPRLRWQINSFWSQRQVSCALIITLCACRIVRAFLIEEVKQMKRLMQQKERSSKKSKKSKSKGKKKWANCLCFNCG